MAYIDKWDKIFDNFAISFPGIAEDVIDWYPSGQFEITVITSKGRTIYNDITDTIRNSIERTNLLSSEQEWRYNFKRRLTRKMYERCVNQKRLSEITGVSEQTLSKYLNGHSSPSTYNIVKLANALECSISELIELDDLSID